MPTTIVVPVLLSSLRLREYIFNVVFFLLIFEDLMFPKLEDDLMLLILLISPPKRWDYRHVPPSLFLWVLGYKSSVWPAFYQLRHIPAQYAFPLILYRHLFMYWGGGVPQHACGGQRLTWGVGSLIPARGFRG